MEFHCTNLTLKNKCMQQQQAVEIIKQVIDESLKAGVFKTIEATAIVYEALKKISESNEQPTINS